jgi:lysophospholipase L1-like esterase
VKRTLAAVVLVLSAACGSDRDVRLAETPDMPRAQHAPSPAPLPETLQVVTLGDSLAFGAGDESHGGIARRLDAELRARGITTVQTTNLGVNGAQTADLLTRLEQKRVRNAIADADAVILSIGANDLFRSPHSREEVLRAPIAIADRILGRIERIVAEIHAVNPEARVLVLGGYNPVPSHEWAPTINQYLGMWDVALSARFEEDKRVAVVKMSDIVTPQRLSRYDSFHPGGEAYAEAAKRIAAMLVEGRDAA